MHRPFLRTRAESLAQPAAELIVTDVGGDLEIDPQRLPGQRRVAGLAADAQIVVVDDGLGAGFRPWRDRADDQVDIDIADHCERPHHSLRVILVVRTGVPALSTRLSAKAIMRR